MMDLKQMIDDLYLARQARLDAQKAVDKAFADEKVTMAFIQQVMSDEGLTELSGMFGSFAIKVVMEPSVTDWTAFYQHIKDTGEVDLLQKRPMVSAIKARWEAGDDVPGIARLETETCSIGKAK